MNHFFSVLCESGRLTQGSVFLPCLWRFSWSSTVHGSYVCCPVKPPSCILLWASPISGSIEVTVRLFLEFCAADTSWVEWRGLISLPVGSYLKTLFFLYLPLHMFSNNLVCLQKEILWKIWDLALCIFPHRIPTHLGMLPVYSIIWIVVVFFLISMFSASVWNHDSVWGFCFWCILHLTNQTHLLVIGGFGINSSGSVHYRFASSLSGCRLWFLSFLPDTLGVAEGDCAL